MTDDQTPPKPPGPVMTGEPPAFTVADLMRRAMSTTYGMIARETVAGLEATASIDALIELLISKGLIDAAELAALREAASQRLASARSKDWAGPWLTMVSETQREQPAEILDCETRHPHCRSACCVFYRVILTEDEVRKRQLLWDLGAPYSLPRGPGGHCAYLERTTLACTVWQDRPHVCRGYSCSKDTEIWKDFDNMVPTERVVAMSRPRRMKTTNDE